MTMREFVHRGKVGSFAKRRAFETAMLRGLAFQTNDLEDVSLVTADREYEFWKMAFEFWESLQVGAR
jgi:hypothetical protein